MKTIYELRDPRDGMCRYVGVAAYPKERLVLHISRARTMSKQGRASEKDAWLVSLDDAGMEPVLSSLEMVDDELAMSRERHWIRARTSEGAPLLNGGDRSSKVAAKRRTFVTVSELAAVFGVDAKTIHNWANNGKIPAPLRSPGGGGHRKWNVSDAVSVVRKNGYTVPEEWEAAP